MELSKLEKISNYEWFYPKKGRMNVDSFIVGSQEILESVDDSIFTQIENVASLPGILEKYIVMPCFKGKTCLDSFLY